MIFIASGGILVPPRPSTPDPRPPALFPLLFSLVIPWNGTRDWADGHATPCHRNLRVPCTSITLCVTSTCTSACKLLAAAARRMTHGCMGQLRPQEEHLQACPGAVRTILRTSPPRLTLALTLTLAQVPSVRYCARHPSEAGPWCVCFLGSCRTSRR